MVVIRLSRGGSKKRPFYHLVATNSRNARDGRYIERLGFYNPIATGGEIPLQVSQERIDYWLSQGAKPSERVAHLLENFAAIAAGTLKKKSKPKKATVAVEAPAPEVAAEVVEEKPAEPEVTETPAPEVAAEPKEEVVAEAKPEEAPKVEAEEKAEETKPEAEPAEKAE